jgi:hypothetical protein
LNRTIGQDDDSQLGDFLEDPQAVAAVDENLVPPAARPAGLRARQGLGLLLLADVAGRARADPRLVCGTWLSGGTVPTLASVAQMIRLMVSTDSIG